MQVHPGGAELAVDEEGLLPEWVLYNELIATSRPFMRCVCAVDASWLDDVLPALQAVDVAKLR